MGKEATNVLLIKDINPVSLEEFTSLFNKIVKGIKYKNEVSICLIRVE